MRYGVDLSPVRGSCLHHQRARIRRPRLGACGVLLLLWRPGRQAFCGGLRRGRYRDNRCAPRIHRIRLLSQQPHAGCCRQRLLLWDPRGSVDRGRLGSRWDRLSGWVPTSRYRLLSPLHQHPGKRGRAPYCRGQRVAAHRRSVWLEESRLWFQNARWRPRRSIWDWGLETSSVPPAGFEPAHPAPEAGALSPELRGLELAVYRWDGMARQRLYHPRMTRFPDSIRAAVTAALDKDAAQGTLRPLG